MEQAVAILAVLIVLAAVLGLARIYVRRRFDVMFLAFLLIGFWFVFRPAQLALGLDSATPDYLFASGYLELVLIAEAAALLWLAGFGLGAAVGGIAGGPVAMLLPRLEQEPSPFFVVIGLAAVTGLAGLVTLWLLTASGGSLAGYHYFVARLSLFRLAFLGTLFLVVFLGLRVIRDTLLFPEGVVSPLEGANVWRQIAIAMHGSQFDALLLVLRDFDLTAGLRWGEDFVAGLAALFPRAIWPDPPVSSLGAWFRQIYEPETINGWPITMLGERLVNFGWTGVALGGAASGYVLRAARDTYDDLWRNPWSLVMSIVVALFLFPGGINVASPQTYLLVAVPMILIALALRIFAPMRGRWIG